MLYTCSPHCTDPTHHHAAAPTGRARSAALSMPSAASASAPVRGDRPPVVDVHCHYLNPEVAKAASDLDVGRHDPSVIHANALTRETNVAQMRERAPKLTGVDQRLDDMDRMGIDIQAISPAPFQFFYFTPPERGAVLARQVNEGIAALVAATPRRFVGLGSVPLQNAELAIQELDHAIGTLGLRGIEINTNVNGLDLTDARLGLEPFFARADALGAVIFLHPVGFSEGSRLTDHYFNNVIGNPLDTTVAVSHLIFDGVVARHPNIRFIAAHGGGYVAHYWARMDHAWRARKDCRTVIDRAPSSYLKTFYVDTMVFDPEMLRHLVDLFGADRVLLGTDYPYDMGEERPRELIASVRGLSSDEVAQIEGLNALKLLDIAPMR
ncbi:amidohydrolase family protein [Variovorax ginsengisoli]|uniref:Amidohydrolase family protein n=1 Tax=Variovorax ginsengisoli TaxID=363844 RepID=A0ABT8S3Y0_9BURK|nr:amidohydrolase family protein [Variovorax ginsengisoli]MDN8614456.1 amidohydrolase family protein [Variovorax ginsengisoli]MDO1533626.1 amidohydrolase family protein [Variovorax ginsengisoli]